MERITTNKRRPVRVLCAAVAAFAFAALAPLPVAHAAAGWVGPEVLIVHNTYFGPVEFVGKMADFRYTASHAYVSMTNKDQDGIYRNGFGGFALGATREALMVCGHGVGAAK